MIKKNWHALQTRTSMRGDLEAQILNLVPKAIPILAVVLIF